MSFHYPQMTFLNILHIGFPPIRDFPNNSLMMLLISIWVNTYFLRLILVLITIVNVYLLPSECYCRRRRWLYFVTKEFNHHEWMRSRSITSILELCKFTVICNFKKIGKLAMFSPAYTITILYTLCLLLYILL